MAVIALNKFRTIRVGITTNLVGIYTCPTGVATIIILSQVTNVAAAGSL
jgi:ribose 5-phosphate isomerase RpiB